MIWCSYKRTSQMARSKILKGTKMPHVCVDGPYDGRTLWLSSSYTMVFTAKGMRGRYETAGLRNLYWRAM